MTGENYRAGDGPGNGTSHGNTHSNGPGNVNRPGNGSGSAVEPISSRVAGAAFGDALRGAIRCGLLVIRRVGGRGRLKLVCPACGSSLALPNLPTHPTRGAQRIDRFVGRHVVACHIREVTDG